MALPGCRVRISEEKEIQVQGKNVMMGYYKNCRWLVILLVYWKSMVFNKACGFSLQFRFYTVIIEKKIINAADRLTAIFLR